MGIVLPEFIILFVAAIAGSAAVIPYSLRLAKGKPLKFSMPTLILLSVAQNAVLFGVVIWLGLLAAHAIGFGAPYLEAMVRGLSAPEPTGLIAGLILGILTGAMLLIADLYFEPHWPQSLRDTTLNTTVPDNFLAAFYGGINEELLMRLFGLSALAWLISLIAPLNVAILWIVNIVMTILFGLGHLPALKKLLGTLPPFMVWRSLFLNAPVGLACGWLFWTYGIEAAIAAHFSADIIYHVLGTVILRRKLQVHP